MGEMHLRVGRGAIEASIASAGVDGSTAWTARAEIANLQEFHVTPFVSDATVPSAVVTSAALDIPAAPLRSAAAVALVAQAAAIAPFTLALARSCGDVPPLGVLKAADAVHLIEYGKVTDSVEDRLTLTVYNPSRGRVRCLLPTAELTGAMFSAVHGAPARPRVSLERCHVMMADEPVESSTRAISGVSIDGCYVQSTTGQAVTEAAHVTTALSMVHQIVAISRQTPSMLNRMTRSTGPNESSSRNAGDVTASLGEDRHQAFGRAVDCIARSAAKELHQSFQYTIETVTTGRFRPIASLDPLGIDSSDAGVPVGGLPPTFGSLVIHGGTGGLGTSLCQCFLQYNVSLILSSRSGVVNSSWGRRFNGRDEGSSALAGSPAFYSSGFLSLLVVRKSISGLREDSIDLKDHARLSIRDFRLVHAAGVLRDAGLRNQTPALVREMFAPKVQAADLAFGVSSGFTTPMLSAYAFSSVAALLHPAGSSTYGAVNAVMESIAASTMHMGVEAVAIQWGAWKSIGMVCSSRSVERAMKKMGIGMIRPVDGLGAFLTIVGQRHATPLIACVPFEEHQRIADSPQVTDMVVPTVQTDGQLVGRIHRVLSSILGQPVHSMTESLVHYGADSLCAIDIQRALSQEFGIFLPPTVLYDYPTIEAMASALRANTTPASAEPDAHETANIASVARCSDILDVMVGIESMVLRSPASADVTADCTAVAAYERWDVDELARDAPKARFGKFLSGYELFDTDLFKVSAYEAVSMDPQQRILLEDSFAVAGTSSALDVGVVVGMSFWDYSTISEKMNSDLASQSHAMMLTGRNLSVASGRISYAHGYRGPSMTIDTACSSSLVAIHAASSILIHDSPSPSRMIVASAMLSLSPDVVRSLSMASMISDEGRSRTLDRQANGYGRGEATAVLTIRRIIDDMSRYRIMGIVVGSAVNQDGRSASLTAPNGPSQLDLLRRAFAAADIRPSHVCIHELHGTGTPLGDPIEMVAVSKAQQAVVAGSPTPAMFISATKTAFGHAEPAAGCIGVYSVIGQLFHLVRHPLLHLGSISSLVEPSLVGTDRADGAGRRRIRSGGNTTRYLVPSRAVAPIPSKMASIGSSSAFAFQGTNANVLVESVGSVQTGLGVVSSLPELTTYRGQRHWFVGGVHSWMHPVPLLDKPLRLSREVTWMAHPGRRLMHVMRQHVVFDKSLLAGMAIFRIMSDAGAMTLAGEKVSIGTASSSATMMLCTASIKMPVVLDGRNSSQLVVRISVTTGRVQVSSHSGQEDVATGELATALVSRRSNAAYRSGTRSVIPTTQHVEDSNSNAQQIYIGALALEIDGDHEETVTEPSIESLDAATHSAAYKEACLGMRVSVPVSCHAMDITWRRTPRRRTLRRRVAASVSCDDMVGIDTCAVPDVADRVRSYNIGLPGCGERRLRSLHSKILGAPRRRKVEHVEQLAHVDELNEVQGSSASSVRVTARCRSLRQLVRRSLAYHECIRAFQVPRTMESHSGDRDPLLDGQLRVAARELAWTPRSSGGSGRRAVMTPVPCPSEPVNRPDLPGSMLNVIVGGTSGIGQTMAGWAAARSDCWGSRSYGCRDALLLVGRRGVLAPASSVSIITHGTCIVSSLDCSRRVDTGALAAMCQRSALLVGGRCAVVHAAGVIIDESFMSSSAGAWKTVFAPKFNGIVTVSSGIAAMPVEGLIALSTASIDIGNSGQANYVSANIAMESVSRDLRHSGMPSQIVRYGPWKSVGMLSGTRSGTASTAISVARLARMGMTLMTPLEGLLATATFLRSMHACATIGHFDWPTVLGYAKDCGVNANVNTATAVDPRALVGSIVSISTIHEPTNISKATITRDMVQKTIQGIAGDEADFFGLDSLSSMEIRNRLSAALSTTLPATLLFDYPTAEKLVEHLVTRLDLSSKDSEGRSPAGLGRLVTGPAAASDRDRLHAVYVSRSSQMVPGLVSTSFEAMSGVFRERENLQRTVPLDRWDQDARFSATGGPQFVYTNFATFVDRLWAFDADIFGMKMHEVQHTDPQARCLLTNTATALGHGTGRVGGLGGVFVGCMFYDYLRSFEILNVGLDPSVVLGNGSPYLNGRLSYTFDLVGPCVGIDTACSSSLVAAHSARAEIEVGSIDFAVVSGANAIILPHTSALICQLGALSRTGRCLSLDAAADGYGRGEAFVTCILSNFGDDETLAVVNATAVNQDGRSISLTAPNGPSQERLIGSSLATGRLRPIDVHAVSIHGTGTLLGDPIETQALSNIFDARGRAVPVSIVANKSLLGHCEGAAGTTGLLNALFSASHGYYNGIHTLRNKNPYLVLTSVAPRRASGPLPTSPSSAVSFVPPACGTSSFGMSGTNAHGIVTTYDAGRAAWGGTRVDSYLRERLFPQSGPGGRATFVPVSRGSLLFHVRYTQSHAIDLCDHYVRVGTEGAEAVRPLLAATAQLEVAGSVAKELVSRRGQEILHGIAFLRPTVVIWGSHLTILEIDATRGAVSLCDERASVGELAAGRQHAVATIGRVASESASERAPIAFKMSYHAFLSRQMRANATRNTAIVGHRGLASASMDAALHLSLAGEPLGSDTQRVPISCDAVKLDSSIHFATQTSLWATDLRLAASETGIWAAATRESFCAIGLVSRPFGRLKNRTSSDIWMGCVVDPVSVSDASTGMAGSPGPSAAGPADLIGCLRVIQLLQQGHVSDLEPSKISHMVLQALRRVAANETHREAADDSFLSPTSSATTLAPAWNPTSPDISLTSLGGIGSLIAMYYTTFAHTVRACCRTPTGRRRFEQHIAVAAMSGLASVTVVNHDLSHQEDAHAFLIPIPGVTIHHTAGTLRDALIGNVTHSDIATTLAPKLRVIDNIVSGLGQSAVDALCAFSSISSIFGTRGQATYAMINAALDERTQVAWSRGLPCLAIQWGLWEQQEVGMAASLGLNATRKLESLGFLRLSPVEGLSYLELTMCSRGNSPVTLVTKMDESVLSGGTLLIVDQSLDQTECPCGRLEKTDISETLRRVFYHTASERVDETLPVLQQGLDSVSSVEFTQALENAIGIMLPRTFVYDYPLLEDMVAYIRGRLSLPTTNGTDIAAVAVAPLQPTSRPSIRSRIAVVSHASKYPESDRGDWIAPFRSESTGVLRRGPFHSLDAFASAFDHHEMYAFDADLFRLGHGAALAMDPNVRWLLTLQADLLASVAFASPASTARVDGTGVYLGWMWSNEYGQQTEISPNAVTATSAPFAVGYVAYTMQMCGPCVPVDTACSSSLVALHLAKAAIENGDCSMASVNGVNAFLSMATWSKIQSISAESRDGRCKTLDAAADGYGRGEGFVAMLLLGVSWSEVESLIAVVSGSACSTAGRRSALTAPNGPAQTAVVQDALGRAEWPDVDSVALHGTGTALGDPIEVRSLVTSLPTSRGFHLSAPKASVGHTEGAAGLTNVLSAIGAGSQRCIESVQNLRKLNKLLLTDIRGFVPRQAGPIAHLHDKFGAARVTGCSSFGMSGVNAHAIVTVDCSRNPAPAVRALSRINPVLDSTADRHVVIPTMPISRIVVVAAGSRRSITWHLLPSMDEARLAWMSDHIVNGQPIFPGTFFLAIGEMICEALALASPSAASGAESRALCDTTWMRTVSVRDLFQLSVVAMGDGTISCGSVFATTASTLTVVSGGPVATTGGGMPKRASVRLTTENTEFNTIPTIIAQLGSTRTYTGDARFPAVARADATLHMTATSAGQDRRLYVPVSLRAYTDKRHRRDNVARADGLGPRGPLGGFATGLSSAAIFDAESQRVVGRRIVGACANVDMLVVELLGASLDVAVGRSTPAAIGTTDAVDGVADRAKDLSYVIEMEADICDHLHISKSCASMPRRVSVWNGESSFAANVAALQCGNIDLQAAEGSNVTASGSCSITEASRLLVDTFRAETGRFGTKFPQHDSAIRTTRANVGFRRTILPASHVPRDAFPIRLPPEANLGDMYALQIEVQSVALNFRDFLVAMGLYPSAVDPATMGSDFAGVVVGVGKHLRQEDLRVGDQVFGQSKGVLKDRICVAPELVSPVPEGVVTPEEASTLSTVFLTAIKCIKCIGYMNQLVHSDEQDKRENRSMLIHAASGGLGLALTQVARAKGLLVLATAGSPFKRSFVRSGGLNIVCNSRDLMFADELVGMSDLDPAGVGTVVNTLTSPGMIGASQSILKLGGHFIEVSKRDIFSHERILQDRPDLQYHIVAVDMMPAGALSGDLYEIATMLARGEIAPIPVASFSLSQMSHAMSRFKSSRAIGKTVCSRADEGLATEDQATWLVTGGAGMLGTIATSLLMKTGSVNLVLPVRRMRLQSAKMLEAGDSTEDVRTSASLVHFVLADVGGRSDFSFLETTKVQGLIHSSGVIRDGLIPNIRSMRPSYEVFAAKSAPMLGHLRGTGGTFLSAVQLVISFSSVSSVVPNPGQGNYGWANALLDGVAEADSRRGCRHIVVNWGPWAGGGMAAHLDERSLSGLHMIDPSVGSYVLEGLLRGARRSLAVDRVMCLALSADKRAVLLGNSLDSRQETAVVEHSETPVPSWGRESVSSAIWSVVTGLLDDAHRDALRTSAPLMQAGVDSLGSLELVSSLRIMFGVHLPQTFLFDCPTIDSMVEHITPLVATSDTNCDNSEEGGTGLIVPATSPPMRLGALNTRVVQISDWVGALPTVRRVPLDRWDCDRPAGPAPPRFGGFVDASVVETFDPTVFGVSVKESMMMDPQHRVLLMQVAEVRGDWIPQTSVAVGVGRLEDPWHVLHATESLIREGNGFVSTSRAASASAGRISYHFDFRGGCLAIDTACSSSLVALHVLVDSMFRGVSPQHGILGGVNLPMSARTSAMLGASAMLAADGRCKTLDGSADGYGRSEGAAVIKMSNALTGMEGFASIAIMGTAVNQDGRSAGLTAPNGPAQEDVVRAAIAGSRQVRVAGMHGTGTPLGDPIEVGSLQRVFKRLAIEGDQVTATKATATTLFASKAALGHAETASGIFGLIMNIQMTGKLSIDGMLTLRHLNRHVVDSMPAGTRVPRESGPCIIGDPHANFQDHCHTVTSCVSAFAFQGSNASALSCVSRPHAAQRQLVCLASTRITQLPSGHPLITTIRFRKALTFECGIMHPSLRLSDHRVAGSAVFPASGYVDVMMAIAETLSVDGRMLRLENIGYHRPYLMDASDFHLNLVVDAVSGRATMSNAADVLCSAIISTTAVNRISRESNDNYEGRMSWPPSRSLCVSGRSADRVPGVIARTSVLDGHVVHAMDSTWHLCAFFVAIEELNEVAPALRIPRTLGAFCHGLKGSWAGHPGRQVVEVSLSRHVFGLFQADSVRFRAADLYLDRVVKNPVDKSKGAAAPVTPMVPVYAMSSWHADRRHTRSSVRLSDSATIGSLLGSVQLGVVPDVSASLTPNAIALRAGVDVADRIREGPSGVDPTDIMQNVPFHVVDLRSSFDTPARIIIDRETTVLVTGGAGAIGSLARSFVAMTVHGAHVVSLSRSHGSGRISPEAITGHSSFVRGDAALDGLCLEAVCGTVGLTTTVACRPRKTVIINAAGILIDQWLKDVDIASARAVLAPKHAGTAALARATGALPAAFLHCGSIATVVGNEGQASYIVANAILASLSRGMSERGEHSVVVHFGPFANLGRGMASAAIQHTLERRGVPLLSPVDGMRAINLALMHLGFDQYCAFDLDAYLTSTASVHPARSTSTTTTSTIVSDDTRPNTRREATIGVIAKIVSRLVDSNSPDSPAAARAKFVDLGLDSLAAVEFAEALRQEFGLSFTNTIVFDYPTVADLASHIDIMLERTVVPAMSVPSIARLSGDAIIRSSNCTIGRQKIHPESIAIIDVANRFPDGGYRYGALSLMRRWTEGIEVQSLVPPARWDVDAYYAPIQTRDHMYVRTGGWLREIDMFDHAAFGLTHDEGLAMDPQLRLLLELTYELTKGRPNMSIPTNSTSNFVGCMYQEYLDGVLQVAGLADTVAAAITSTGMSFLVGRLSYHFNLRGQSVSCDTACSSSLVAVHLATGALGAPNAPGTLGATSSAAQSAIAHGVNMMLSPQTTARICMLQALSPVGRCKTADTTADGYCRSESAMSILIGRCFQAGDDGVLAILLGSGIGHNGTTGGISAPHGPSQTRLIADVWREAGVEVAAVAAASLHGTGTSLGDPIEFQALQAVWKRVGAACSAPLPLLATKAWAGHMEGTAGLVGLMLPMLESTIVAPIMHLRTLNEHISRQEPRDVWVSRQTAPGGRSAAVASSSFGMGGTNAHALVDVKAMGAAHPENGEHVFAGFDTLASPVTPFIRQRSWPAPSPFFAQQRARAMTTTVVAFEFIADHAHWIHDHVIRGRKLLAGATMLAALADAGSSLRNPHESSRGLNIHIAVTSIAFLKAADLDPVMAVSVELGSSIEWRAVYSVAGISTCTASFSRVISGIIVQNKIQGGIPSPVGAVSAISLGTSATWPAGMRRPSSIAFVDRRVHSHLSSLEPCVADASMHLGLVTRNEGRVPVSVDAFIRDNASDFKAVGVPFVSCLSFEGDADEVIDTRSQAPGATLIEVRSKQPRVFAGDHPVVLRARVDELDITGRLPIDPDFVESVIVGPTRLKTAKVPTIITARISTVGGTRSRRSTEDWHGEQSWHAVFSAVSQSLREYGGSMISLAPGTPMGAALSFVAGKEHPTRLAVLGYKATSEFNTVPFTSPAVSPYFSYASTRGYNVVTGAFGGIGAAVARWLEVEGAPSVLLGRRVRALGRLGDSDIRQSLCLTEIMQCDTSSASDISEALRARNLGIASLHHVAGTVRDAIVQRTTPSDIRATVSGKSGETMWSLMDFDMVVGGAQASLLYASITGVIGNQGQLAYSYANGLLNEIAVAQSGRGIPTQSIAWGAWAGNGMAHGMERALAASGVRAMRPADGLRVLELLSRPFSGAFTTPVIVAGVFEDIDRLISGAMQGGGAEATPTVPGSNRDDPPPFPSPFPTPSLLSHTSNRLDGHKVRILVRDVLEKVGREDDTDETSILSNLDSLQSVATVDMLSQSLGIMLSPTILYDYPTFNLLVEHLVGIVCGDGLGKDTVEADPSTALATGTSTAIVKAEEKTTSQTIKAITSIAVTSTGDVLAKQTQKRFVLRTGYYCSPDVDALSRLDETSIRRVSNFVIGREGHGEIRFLTDVDLTDVDLSTEVYIGKRGMMVSKGAKPGERLNQPALMCFLAPQVKSSASRRRLRSALAARTFQEAGPRLVFVDEDVGSVVLFVEDWY